MRTYMRSHECTLLYEVIAAMMLCWVFSNCFRDRDRDGAVVAFE